MPPRIYLFGLLIAASPCVACQRTTEDAVESAMEREFAKQGELAEVKIDGESPSMEVKAADGRSEFNVGPGTPIPPGFPQDIPLYPDQTILIGHAQVENAVFMIQAKTDDAVEEVVDFYGKTAAERGWQESTRTTSDSRLTILAYEKEDRRFQVVVQRDNSQTSLTLSTSRKLTPQ
jgi:hypothetical protein